MISMLSLRPARRCDGRSWCRTREAFRVLDLHGVVTAITVQAYDPVNRRAFYMLATGPFAEFDVVAVNVDAVPPTLAETPSLCGFIGVSEVLVSFLYLLPSTMAVVYVVLQGTAQMRSRTARADVIQVESPGSY